MKINTGSVRISVTHARFYNHCCHWNALSITYPESLCVCVCVCSLSYLARSAHAPHIGICGMSTSLPYFRTFCYKEHDLRTNFAEQKLCFDFFLRPLFATLPVLRRIQWYSINVRKLSCEYPLFLSDCNETCIFSTAFIKKTNTKFHDYPSIGSGVPYRRTDRHDEANFVPFAIFWMRSQQLGPLNEFLWYSLLEYFSSKICLEIGARFTSHIKRALNISGRVTVDCAYIATICH